MDNADVGKLVLRLSVGGLLLLHGIAKLRHGIGPIADQLGARGLPEVLAKAVYFGEILAPVLILLGIVSRIGGIVVAVTMLGAVALMHLRDVAVLGESGGWALELPALYFFGAVSIALLGSGKYAVAKD